MEYASKFSQEVKRKLESLRSAIDQDIGNLDNSAPNLTFSQADQILTGASSLLDSYRGFMGQLYRGVGKTYASRRTSNGSGVRGKMEPAALETMDRQGYLAETEFASTYGFNRNAVSRKLQELAATYNWRRERTDSGWQYRPVAVKKEESVPPAVEPTENADAAKEQPPAKIQRKRRQPTAPASESGDSSGEEERQ